MYNRQPPGHERVPKAEGRPNYLHINRTEALDELTHRSKQGLLRSRDARKVGRRLKEGMGDYYRHMLASRRTIETDGNGKYQARWIHGSARPLCPC